MWVHTCVHLDSSCFTDDAVIVLFIVARLAVRIIAAADALSVISTQAAGGFAGPGAVTFSDSSPEPILISEADSFVIEGVFARVDGEPLDPATILHLYIFDETSSVSAASASRGTAAVDPVTGAFTAAVTDTPAGDSTLVMSFVLSQDDDGAVGRRLVQTTGTRSVHTVPVVNPTLCTNALAITLTWEDSDSDVDLWVLEPGGQDVGYTNLNGVRFLLRCSHVCYTRILAPPHPFLRIWVCYRSSNKRMAMYDARGVKRCCSDTAIVLVSHKQRVASSGKTAGVRARS